MSAKQKSGAKFGRNRDRNPSSKMQKLRTARNKAKRAQKVVHTPAQVNDPKFSKGGNQRWMMVSWRGTEQRVYCQ